MWVTTLLAERVAIRFAGECRVLRADSIPRLAHKIQDKTVRVCVIGLGYVGLPLAVLFADAGCKTIGVDIDTSKILDLMQGRPYIRDPIVEEALSRVVENGSFEAINKLERGVEQSDFIILCLPTPVNRRKQPDLHAIRDALLKISKVLTPAKFVIIESSVYPGFTEHEARAILEESNLKAGSDFGLAYSPERINFGSAPFLPEISKLVGGINSQCTDVAAELYKLVIQAEVTKVSSPSVAEAAKMVENVYRHVNISLVNELAILFEKMGIDTFEVIRAASTKPFGFQPHFPGPGVGGHCIPKDPYYLIFRAQHFRTKLGLPLASVRINSRMASHVCRGIRKALGTVGKSVSRSRITILGLAYKAETNEARNSPAINIIKGLSRMGAEIVTYDPHVLEVNVAGRHYRSAKRIEDALAKSDCYVFLVDHKAFRNIDLNLLKSNANPPPLVYDARGMFQSSDLVNRGICYAGLGKPSLLPVFSAQTRET